MLVAGCGTSQAVRHAVRWPAGRVVGIDVSETSLRHSEELGRRYALDNLELHQLPIERVGELGRRFDLVVCTGVLHHLAHPDGGLQALSEVLQPDGAMSLMVYARYGRLGVEMMQEYAAPARHRHVAGAGATSGRGAEGNPGGASAGALAEELTRLPTSGCVRRRPPQPGGAQLLGAGAVRLPRRRRARLREMATPGALSTAMRCVGHHSSRRGAGGAGGASTVRGYGALPRHDDPDSLIAHRSDHPTADPAFSADHELSPQAAPI